VAYIGSKNPRLNNLIILPSPLKSKYNFVIYYIQYFIIHNKYRNMLGGDFPVFMITFRWYFLFHGVSYLHTRGLWCRQMAKVNFKNWGLTGGAVKKCHRCSRLIIWAILGTIFWCRSMRGVMRGISRGVLYLISSSNKYRKLSVVSFLKGGLLGGTVHCSGSHDATTQANRDMSFKPFISRERSSTGSNDCFVVLVLLVLLFYPLVI
jgi:hypothetical protein